MYLYIYKTTYQDTKQTCNSRNPCLMLTPMKIYFMIMIMIIITIAIMITACIHYRYLLIMLDVDQRFLRHHETKSISNEQIGIYITKIVIIFILQALFRLERDKMTHDVQCILESKKGLWLKIKTCDPLLRSWRRSHTDQKPTPYFQAAPLPYFQARRLALCEGPGMGACGVGPRGIFLVRETYKDSLYIYIYLKNMIPCISFPDKIIPLCQSNFRSLSWLSDWCVQLCTRKTFLSCSIPHVEVTAVNLTWTN